MLFYYIHHNTSFERRYTFAWKAEPTSPLVRSECPDCERSAEYAAGSFDVEVEGGSTFPDFLGCGSYPYFIVSERVVSVWREAGIECFLTYPVKVRKAVHSAVKLQRAPKYYRLEVTGQCMVDFVASGLTIIEVCKRCGEIAWKPYVTDRYKLMEGSWDGSDLFRDIRFFPCMTLCTPKVREVTLGAKLTNVAFEEMG